MTASQYMQWTQPIRKRPTLLRVLHIANSTLTYLCYLLYPVLLICLAISDRALLLRCILTPGISFILVSLFRRFLNAKRPYEVLAIHPLIHKDTHGKSFPSRHVFSVFVIAMCWFAYRPAIGIGLCVVGLVMAVIRVLGGVHFPRDVLAGACIGILSGVIGLYIV